ncbi:hypothetical protein PINS_up020055 [Pythium insidiosum]|nr:hypothetical protein PINS_up020055 [Pythium insidiosum]
MTQGSSSSSALDVKLAKALVWLSSTAVARQDGVVALLETEILEQRLLCYGTVDAASEFSTERAKRWRMLPVKWTAPNDERLSLTSATTMRVALFLLHTTAAQHQQQRQRTTANRTRVSFVGASVFAPSEQDQAALAASQEVLFTARAGS